MTTTQKQWLWITVVALVAFALGRFTPGKGLNFKNGNGNRSTQRTSYNTSKCCKPENPCGWSKSTYDSQCGSST